MKPVDVGIETLDSVLDKIDSILFFHSLQMKQKYKTAADGSIVENDTTEEQAIIKGLTLARTEVLNFRDRLKTTV